MDVSVWPKRDTFHIGDTIWFELIIPEYKKENKDSAFINISKYPEFNISVGMGQYVPDHWEFAVNDFQYVSQTGYLTPRPPNIYVTLSTIANNQLMIRAGMIPLETGLFRYGMIALTPDGYDNAFQDECRGFGYFEFQTNGLDSNNWHLLAPVDPSLYCDYDEYKNKIGGYTFVVVE